MSLKDATLKTILKKTELSKKNFLDLGPGSGRWLDFVKKFKPKRIFAADISLEIKKNPVLQQDFVPILNSIFENIDPNKGGYFGAPKFPVFNIYETFLYFYNKNKDEKYFQSIETFIKKICSGGIYDHVEGGISRYTVDENWLIPHFEKMLYDNAQFILLLSKYCKINSKNYFREKLDIYNIAKFIYQIYIIHYSS